MHAQLYRQACPTPSRTLARARSGQAAVPRLPLTLPVAPSPAPVVVPRRADDPLGSLLARAVTQRVEAAASARLLPQPVLMRQFMLTDEQLDELDELEQEEEVETWEAWAKRQVRNPWVWAGVGLGCVAGLSYLLKSESVKDSVTKMALENPSLVAEVARRAGEENVARVVAPVAASALRKAAEQAAAGAQTPAEHFADVVDGLVRIIPGGGVMNAAVKTVTTIAENEEIAACARDVAGDLGPQFILNVVAKVAREHGGELVLDAVDVATKPLLGAATFSLTHHGSHWA